MDNKKTKISLLIIIIGIAVFFRLWKLDSLPPGLYPDVAMNGTNAIQAINQQDYRVFYPENNGREGLFMNLIAFSFQAFGIHMWSLRIVGSLIGIGTVVGIYFLTKTIITLSTYSSLSQYSNQRLRKESIIALLSTFFIATSFWHVNFSRIGFRAIMVPFVMVWCFYFLLRWWNVVIQKSKFKTLRYILPIFAGIFFGVGFHTYIAFRFAPFIVMILAFTQLIYLLKNKYYKNIIQWFLGYIVFSITAIFVMSPLLLYFYQNPQDFMGRAGQVSIFEQPNPLSALAESLIKTIGMVNIYGDPNWRHNYSGSPLLYWPIGIFFLAGLFQCMVLPIKRFFKKLIPDDRYHVLDTRSSIFIMSWLILILAPSYLTAEGLPHALRSIGAIPPIMILSGIGAWLIYEKIRHLQFFTNEKNVHLKIEVSDFQLILKIAAFIILIVITFNEFKKYFYDWGTNPEVRGSFTQNLVDVGNFIKNISSTSNVYVIVNEGGVLVEGVPVSAQTVKFVYAIEEGLTTKPHVKYITPEQISGIELVSNIDTIFVPQHYDEDVFNKLRTKFPNGIIEDIQEINYFKIKI